MPIAKSFEKDVFISYCHADNENPMGDGWIDLLHRNLRTRLIQLLGARTPDEEPTIWRDDSLQGNEAFARVLDDRLRKVAIVISVVSPSYVKSDWCRDEIETFCRAAQQRIGLSPANKERLLKVLKTPVDRQRHPPALQSQTGFPFFVLDPSNNRAREFTLTRGDENSARALEVINDLAYSVIDTLNAINATDEACSTAQTRPTGAAAGQRVYLAHAHWEFDDVRRQLRRELESRGHTVVPAGELPLHNPEQFRREVDAALQGCALSIHLVSSRRALILPDESDDIVVLQNRMAAEQCAASALQRLIWMPASHASSAVAEGKAQQAFMSALQFDPAARQGAELLTTTLQALMERIHDTLHKQQQRQAAPAVAIEGEKQPPSVYLIWHPLDEALADTLRESLFDAGLNVLDPLSDPSATEAQIFADHRMKLVECTAALVCIGRAGEFWLGPQLSDLQKAVGWRQGRPLQARGVYCGPPAEGYKKRLRAHGLIAIPAFDGDAQAALQTFIDRVRP